MTYITQYHSPIGPLTIASDGNSITGLWIDGQAHWGTTLTGPRIQCESLPVLILAEHWLDRYFAGEAPSPAEIPITLKGTPFQLEVWSVLQQIPYGQVMTYGQIAQILARDCGVKTMSARAVGHAVGRNPISLIVPCHRVIGANGALTGYAGGIERKEQLLKLEMPLSQL